MRVLVPHHHHHCHGEKDARCNKKSRKIAKKMAKLEKKLCKFSASIGGETTNDYISSRDSSRCRSRSRSHDGCRSRSKSRGAERKRMCRRHRRHGKRFASHGGSSSSSSDSSSESASHSHSSSSSRSPSRSPPRRLQPGHLRHHSRRHHRQHGTRWGCNRHCDAIQTCVYKLLSQSEPNLQAAETSETQEDRGREVDNEQVDLEIPTNDRESEQFVDADNQMDDGVQEIDVEVLEDSALDASLASHWKDIIIEGLSSEVKLALLKKYMVSKNRQILKAPKINNEILTIATEEAIKNDCILLSDQNQIGSGLFALSQAISHLKSNENLQKEEIVKEALEKLNEAADIFLNAHHDLSKARKSIMVPGLKKGARTMLENCKTDDLLFGRDFSEKFQNSKYFKKSKRSSKNQQAEGKSEAGRKRKHNRYEGERRTSKRLDLSGLSIKSS